jgi:hypothetical protein
MGEDTSFPSMLFFGNTGEYARAGWGLEVHIGIGLPDVGFETVDRV